MDKTMAGLLGAVGALVVGTQAHASSLAGAPHTVLEAASYAELLQPIPNALATLKALDAPEAGVQEVQYYYRQPPPYYDRHHHHHHWRRPVFHHHHHHHHHHHGFYR